jgi:hypothetical protein
MRKEGDKQMEQRGQSPHEGAGKDDKGYMTEEVVSERRQ